MAWNYFYTLSGLPVRRAQYMIENLYEKSQKNIYFDNHGIVIEINSKFIYLILITLYIILLKYKKIKKNKK